MEDDLIFSKMKNNLNVFKNEKLSKYFQKQKMTSKFSKIEDDLIFFENGIQPHFWGKVKTIEIIS